MPFKSEQQRKLMWAKHPAIARRWAKRYGSSVRKGSMDRLHSASERTKPVQSKEEVAKNLSRPSPVAKGRRSPPIYQNTVTKNSTPKPSTPLPRPVTKNPAPKTGTTDQQRQNISDALARFRSVSSKKQRTVRPPMQNPDRVQQMQRKGLMIKNVGGADYTGPVNSRAQNLRENARKRY